MGGAGGPSESKDLFRNISHANADAFDREWEGMAQQLGFNYQQNRLGYGSDMPSNFGSGGGGFNPYSEPQRHAMKYGIDNGRRGHYVPNEAKALDAPVRINKGVSDTNGRRQREIMPTVPGGNIHDPSGGGR